MAISWERRHEALKAIHDKIAEVLAKLDNPSDPQIVDIVASIILSVIITSMPEEGTITYFSKSVTADVLSPASGKALKILGWNFYNDADIISELRFKTSGDIIAGIPSKGINAMAKSSINRPQGATDELIEIYLSGAGNVKGWICTKEV